MEYFSNCMTMEQLEQEHKRLVIKLHPDRNPDNPNATAEFQEMQAQYEERKAELNGDYSKARQGRERRERREREERERREREQKEQERRKVEQAVEQARLNRQKGHMELKAGDYIYARQLEFTRGMFEWNNLTCEEMLNIAVRKSVSDECVVVIETIVEMNDRDLMHHYLSKALPEGIWGGFEVLQKADPAAGVRKGKRAAKVVMFRSPRYCVFGNPCGDQTINQYYFRSGYEDMFSDTILQIRQTIEYENQEKERIKAERKTKLLAEQAPLLEEWSDKLLRISYGLNHAERKAVTISNLKTMLKVKFTGTKFNVREDRYGQIIVKWEDGPMVGEVRKVTNLFDAWERPDGANDDLTPWQEYYGTVTLSYGEMERKMSILTKARILQQLGEVTEAFRNTGYDDTVIINSLDWMMLHLLVGIDVKDPSAYLCMNTIHPDGSREVRVRSAVSYIFGHTSYVKEKTTKKKKTKAV